MKNNPFYLLLPACLLPAACTKPAATWHVVEQKDGVLILEGADSVLFYQRSTKSLDGKYPRANYIHPLYSLHNTPLTEGMQNVAYPGREKVRIKKEKPLLLQYRMIIYDGKMDWEEGTDFWAK